MSRFFAQPVFITTLAVVWLGFVVAVILQRIQAHTFMYEQIFVSCFFIGIPLLVILYAHCIRLDITDEWIEYHTLFEAKKIELSRAQIGVSYFHKGTQTIAPVIHFLDEGESAFEIPYYLFGSSISRVIEEVERRQRGC